MSVSLVWGDSALESTAGVSLVHVNISLDVRFHVAERLRLHDTLLQRRHHFHYYWCKSGSPELQELPEEVVRERRW